MKTLAICISPRIKEILRDSYITNFELYGKEMYVGLLELEKSDYSKQISENSVLVEIIAFSCNYRDKAYLLHLHHKCRMLSNGSEYFYSPFGSDFVARVIKIGKKVKTLKVGDRVIPNDGYPFKKQGYPNLGIPTNYASQPLQIFSELDLMKISDSMPDEVAASFTIGAQTAYCMIRRLNLKPHENILITAASSNTSLAMINVLKTMPVNVYVSSSNPSNKEKLFSLGIKGYISHNDLINNVKLKKDLRFDAVFDPFPDIFLHHVIRLMNFSGRYITCGIYEQHASFKKENDSENFSILNIIGAVISNNIVIMGNCLGTTEDLEKAVSDYYKGKYDVIIDSVFEKENVIPFVEKSFGKERKFGKVVYKY